MNFLGMIYFKTKVIFSHRYLCIFLFLFPVLMAFVSGTATQKTQNQTIPIALIDEDQSEASKSIFQNLQQNQGFTVMVSNLDAAQTLLKNAKIEILFVFKKGFEENMHRLSFSSLIAYASQSDSPNSELAKEIISSELHRLFSAYYARNAVKQIYLEKGLPLEEGFQNAVFEKMNSYWHPPLMQVQFAWADVAVPSSAEKRTVYLPNTIYDGIMLLVIMLFVLLSASFILEERKHQIHLRLYHTSWGLFRNYLSNFLGLFFAALLFQCTIAISIYAIMGKPLEDLSRVAMIYLAYTVTCVSISMFLTSFLQATMTLHAITLPFTFLTGFLGGCFVNLSDLNQFAARFTFLTPQGWAMQGFLGHTAFAFKILFLVALCFFILSYWILHRNRLGSMQSY